MERELKITLTSPEDLTSFITHFNKYISIVYLQENRYFTSPYLKENKIALRVRSQNNEFILTEKSKSISTDGYFQCNETNEPLNIKSFEEFKSEKYENLQIQAVIKTIRTVINYNNFCFECDNTVTITPNQHEIFEIECETENPEEARKIIYGVLEDKGIKFEISKKTKLGMAMTENL